MERTICALSTAHGLAAIALIRMSGESAFDIMSKITNIRSITPRYAYFQEIFYQNKIIDQCVVTYYKAPHSYTGEDMVEISCHGSIYIQKKILEILVELGAFLAKAGEFTQRAFLNGKLDLMQVEAVSDLIDSQSEFSHQLAINNIRGGISKTMQKLREQFIEISALLELELDFSEEDVEFADRTKIKLLIANTQSEVKKLLASFKLGNAIKKGIPIAIVGKPNVGKSTLLNTLFNEDKALVSDMPGTTRDSIEDCLIYKGIQFRFIDTAGIRETNDMVENMGVERTYQMVNKADIVIYLVDAKTYQEEIFDYQKLKHQFPDKKWLYIINKCDQNTPSIQEICISAKYKQHIDKLLETLWQLTGCDLVLDKTIISNLRHYHCLHQIVDAVEQLSCHLDQGLSSDILAMDLKIAMNYIGELVGEITPDEVLGQIFSRFCIGK